MEKSNASNSKEYIVQKSHPLMSIYQSGIPVTAMKIMEAYLGKINSHKPDERTVVFEKKELEKLLGVSKINKAELNNRLKALFQPVTIEDSLKKKGGIIVPLFEKAKYYLSEDDGWVVELACSRDVIEYVFNVENKGYFSYLLSNALNLDKRWCLILYFYLEQNGFRKTWTIDIPALRKILDCTSSVYDEFKYFNAKILKPCFEEINAKTTLSYTYEPTERINRQYTKIQFTVTDCFSISGSKKALTTEQDNDVIEAAFENEESEEIDYGGELANLLGESACDNEFCPEEIRVIQDLVLEATRSHDYMEMCDYLSHKVNLMNCYDKRRKNKIKDRFSYLKRMIEKDIENNK